MDAISHGAWQDRDVSVTPPPILSVGVVIEETDKLIRLGGGVAADGDLINSLVIPRGMIRKQWKLGRFDHNPEKGDRWRKL